MPVSPRFSALTAHAFALRRFSRRLALGSLPVLAALLPLSARADTVVLTNGDHLTGTVTQLDGGKLTVHTDYAGDIVIAFAKVSSVKVDKPVILSLNVAPLPGKKKSSKGLDIRKEEITAINRSGTGFTVTVASRGQAGNQAGTEEIAAAELTTVRTAAAQQAYEASLHPGWLHDWTSTANISFALARGNSDTTTIGTGITLVRPTQTDKTSLYYTDIYTHDGILNETTAEHTAAGGRYDHNLNPKLFAFGTADFATDALQYLDLRSVVGGGFGWHAIATPRQQFDVLGGLVWTHESYSSIPANKTTTPVTPEVAAEINSFAALDFGQQYTRKLGASSAFTEQAYIFPDLADTSQFRFTLNSGLTTKIKSFLSWQTTISDVYVTNPPPTTKDNDFILTTGLGFSFTRK
jgi:putative salt-induced outer membrane protein